MSNIKFSICIPNYNYASFIEETISSVLNQNYKNFEIIISDNKSTDNSLEVIYSFDDSRVRVLEGKYNVGFQGNLDKVTKDVKGEYIILLSSDDIMKPSALENYSNLIKKYGKNKDLFLMSGCEIVDASSEVIGKKDLFTGDIQRLLSEENIKKDKINIFDGHFLLKGLFKNRFQTPGQFASMCFSAKLFKSVQGFSSIMSIYPDAHFSHKILLQNPKVIYFDEYLFKYREHDKNNLSSIKRFDNIKSLIDPYHTTLLFNSKELSKINLLNEDLIKAFIKNICLKPALFSILRGEFNRSVRIFFFALSAYPSQSLQNKFFYILILLYPFTPLLKIIHIIYRLIK